MAARYPPEEEEVPANLLQESEIKRHASKQVYDPSGAVSVITRNLTAGSATPLLVKFPTLINVQQYDGMGENRNNEGVFLIPRSPGKCGMIGDLAHARNDTLAQRLAVNCRYTILQAALKTIDKGMVFVIGKYVGDPTYLYARSETIQDAVDLYAEHGKPESLRNHPPENEKEWAINLAAKMRLMYVEGGKDENGKKAYGHLLSWLCSIINEQLAQDKQLHQEWCEATWTIAVNENEIEYLNTQYLDIMTQGSQVRRRRKRRLVNMEEEIERLQEENIELQEFIADVPDILKFEEFYVAEIPIFTQQTQKKPSLHHYITSGIHPEDLDDMFIHAVPQGTPGVRPSRTDLRMLKYVGRLMEIPRDWPWCPYLQIEAACDRPNASKTPDLHLSMNLRPRLVPVTDDDWNPAAITVEIEGQKDTWVGNAVYFKIIESILTPLAVFPVVYSFAVKHDTVEIYKFTREPDRGIVSCDYQVMLTAAPDKNIGECLAEVADYIALAMSEQLKFTTFYRTASQDLRDTGFNSRPISVSKEKTCTNCWAITDLEDVKSKMLSIPNP